MALVGTCRAGCDTCADGLCYTLYSGEDSPSEAEDRCEARGGHLATRRAHRTLGRVRAWKIRNLGRDHEFTLEATGHLANALEDIGEIDEAEELHRELLASWRRAKGEEHFKTIECGQILIAFLVIHREDGIDEARDLHRSIFPVARRVLGPDHFLTRRLQNPAILEALGITDE